MKKILDYSDFVKSTCFHEHGYKPEGKTALFFNETIDGFCPFCKVKTHIVHKDHSFTHPSWLEGGYYDAKEYVDSCPGCGWWKLRCDKLTTGNIDAKSVEETNAVLKSYDLSSKSIPISVLQQHLNKFFEDVIHIHDNRMEMLVQSVFREHFSCDVEHIGKSHDGGIDLILVNSETPTVVQVKRRKKLEHIERVSGIREFLGATILRGSKNCIYVSTCDKFSEPAKLAAKEAIEVGAVESYELYDFDRFCSVLNLETPQNSPWKTLLRSGW